MLDWKTKIVGVLLPALFAVVVLVTLLIGAATVRADDSSKPVSPDGPPPGIVPVSIKLQTVLDANDAAVGRLAHKSITDVEQGTISAYGFIGTYKDVYAGLHSNDDFSATTTLGPFTSGRGRLHGQRWREEASTSQTPCARTGDAPGFITENPKNDDALGEVGVTRRPGQTQGLTPFWSFYDRRACLTASSSPRTSAMCIRMTTTGSPPRSRSAHASVGRPSDRIRGCLGHVRRCAADDVTEPAGHRAVLAGRRRSTCHDITVDTIHYPINMTFADPYISDDCRRDMTCRSITESGIVMDDQVAKNRPRHTDPTTRIRARGIRRGRSYLR
jgi:hypothetical protein